MTPERWATIEKLCQDALDRAPEERSEFLDQACADDPELRAEVESLLEFDASSETFIERPPHDLAAGVMADRDRTPDTADPIDLATSPTLVVASSELPGERPQRPRFFWIALLVGILLAGLYALAIYDIFRFGGFENSLEWQSTVRNGQRIITNVDRQGVAAGILQPGDQIVSFNDDQRFDQIDPRTLTRAYPWGGKYTMTVRRGASEKRIGLTYSPRLTTSRIPAALTFWLIGVVFLAVGWVIGLVRPDQTVPRLASATLLVSAVLFLRVTGNATGNYFFLPLWQRYVFLPVVAFVGLHLALAYHFYYRLPEHRPPNRFWSGLKYFFYGCFTLLTLSAGFSYATWLPGGETLLNAAVRSTQLDIRSGELQLALQVVAFVALCAVVIRSYRLTRPGGERRRVKLLLIGTLVALVPNVIAAAYFVVRTSRPDVSAASLIPNLFTLVIPITTAYAILKHRFLDINVVIRRGLQYALAKNTLRLLLILPIAVLGYRVLANPNQTLVQIFADHPLNVFLIALAAAGLILRKQLTGWIDRLFFREAYDREQILLAVVEEIKPLESREEIAHHVSRQIDAALHPTRVLVFYREEGGPDLTLTYSSNGFGRHLRIPETPSLLRLLDGESGPLEYPSTVAAKVSPGERRWLDELAVNLIVPLAGTDSRLRGFLFLGEKKSEQPYTVMDKRLLAAVAQQMAVVSEIDALKEQVDQGERVKRDVLLHLEGGARNLLRECPKCGTCYDPEVPTCERDQAELALTLPVERTLVERYRLDQLIGKGGMGSVYRATDLKLAREVAVKIMIGNVFGDKSALRRFAREAQATARLNHPNIVSVYDYGTVGPAGAYLIMELIPGVSLKEELKRRGTIPSRLVAEWFQQILAGIEAAHNAGIIHRDLKPDNILIAQTGGASQVKILDFGLAKFRWLNAADSNSLTEPGMVMGTLGYMAPEQIMGDEVDSRSDIFSLGVMLVEALTGRRPFEGKNYGELAASVLNKPFHLDVEYERVDSIVQRCIAKDKNERYGSVNDLRQDLLRILPKPQQMDGRG